MPKVRFLSIAEQVAGYLRAELLSGRWDLLMPGMHELATELGVNHKTVEVALRLLENDGLLVPQGAGKRRAIALRGERARSGLRVEILGFDTEFKNEPYMLDLQHHLKEEGHDAEYASKSLLDLGMDVGRVARMVSHSKADAWVVCAGSREVLEWFATQPKPAFALSGRRRGLPLAGAGPDKSQAISEAVRRFVALGHRRIVMLVREEVRKPKPASVLQEAFLDVLEAHGIPTSSFNLPDWEETPAGFLEVLKSLFKVTRPTALILDEAWAVIPTLQFCLSHGIQIPRDLSLVCSDPVPSSEWCVPPLSHIRWDFKPMVRRVVRWVNSVASGKMDLRQTLTHAELVSGGTIGPAK